MPPTCLVMANSLLALHRNVNTKCNFFGIYMVMKMTFVRGFSLIKAVREFKQLDDFKIVSGLCLQIASLDLSSRYFFGLLRAWLQR